MVVEGRHGIVAQVGVMQQGRVDRGRGEVLRLTINLAKAIAVWKGRLNERVEAAG